MTDAMEVPSGWALARVGDLIQPKTTHDPTSDGDGTFEYIDVSSIDSSRNIIVSPKTVPNEEAPSRARRPVEEDDVLFCLVRPYLRNVAVVPKSLDGQIASTAFCVLRSSGGCDPRFLFYQVGSDEFINTLPTYGNSPPAAREDEFLNQCLRLAPLGEQERIVAKIEELFSELDAGVEALERAQKRLERYRASVLKAAVEGRLTEGWRAENPPHETGEELLERILVERRKRWEEEYRAKYEAKGKQPPKGWQDRYKEPEGPETDDLPDPPDGWCWANLSQLKSYSLYGPRFSSDDYEDQGVLVLRTTDISDDGRVNLSSPPRLPLDDQQLKKYALAPGDLLFTRTGSIGTLAVFDDSVDAIAGAYLIQYRLVLDGDLPRWIELFMRSSSGQRALRGGSAGVGRPNLNAPTIDDIPIPLPPRDEQAHIMTEIRAALSLQAASCKTISDGLVRGDSLQQAILKRAFEGRLVPQDPSDEPASVLLERIQAEGDGREPKRTPRKKKADTDQETLAL